MRMKDAEGDRKKCLLNLGFSYNQILLPCSTMVREEKVVSYNRVSLLFGSLIAEFLLY